MSALEMAQNSARLSWSREEVDEKLKGIMKNIYDNCHDTAEALGALRSMTALVKCGTTSSRMC